MQKLSPNDYKLFKSIVGLKQESLKKTLDSCLRRKYKDVICKKEYLYAKGDIPVALVAHMDTVFKTPPKNIYYDEHQGVMWSPDGLGADDRAGVFAILKILQTGLRPTVIFTTDEEMGGLGAEQLVKDYPTPPNDLNYIIQLDRRGTSDCVFYDCDNQEFVRYVESFGFIENFGSFSDISEICPAWKIAGVNLSVGYEDEHSFTETFHISPFFKTVSKVCKMLKEDYIPKFEYIPSVYAYAAGGFGRGMYSWGWDASPSEDDYNYAYKCAKCGGIFSEYDMIPVKGEHSTKFYCPDCCVGLSWCKVCGEAFEAKDKTAYICPDCNNKGGKVVNEAARSNKGAV